MWDEGDEFIPTCGNSSVFHPSYTYSKTGWWDIAIGWQMEWSPASLPGVHPTKSNTVDRGGIVVDERIDGHENGCRVRRTKAEVNTNLGAGGGYQ